MLMILLGRYLSGPGFSKQEPAPAHRLAGEGVPRGLHTLEIRTDGVHVQTAYRQRRKSLLIRHFSGVQGLRIRCFRRRPALGQGREFVAGRWSRRPRPSLTRVRVCARRAGFRERARRGRGRIHPAPPTALREEDGHRKSVARWTSGAASVAAAGRSMSPSRRALLRTLRRCRRRDRLVRRSRRGEPQRVEMRSVRSCDSSMDVTETGIEEPLSNRVRPRSAVVRVRILIRERAAGDRHDRRAWMRVPRGRGVRSEDEVPDSRVGVAVTHGAGE
jgi:hypothetical protein